MPIESEYFPERSPSTSAEDRKSYAKILYGIFGFHTAAVMSLAGAVIFGINFHKVAHLVAVAWY